MLPLILSVGVGAALGAVIGWMGRCRSGACALTAGWRRGALFGAVLGALLYGGPARDAAGRRELARQDGPVRPVTEATFRTDVLNSELPVLVDFYASWCGPCRRLAPVLAEVAGRYEGRVRFVKVDVDAAPALAREYGVTGVPTLLWLERGRLAGAVAGAVSAAELESRVEEWLRAGGAAQAKAGTRAGDGG